MGDIVSISEASNGISPAIRGATCALRDKVEAALNDAWDQQVPAAMIVGILEMIKADFMERFK